MNFIRSLWISLISNLIWLVEKSFFYPKLTFAYQELNLIHKADGGLVIFDIGSNKGQSISFFRSMYPQAKIYAFEPSKKTFNTLKTKFGKSSQKDINIFQLGLGESAGEVNFYESLLSETSTFALPREKSLYLKKKSRILLQNPKNAYTTSVSRIETLDNFTREKKVEFIDIFKIDVEGFEYEVLQGAKSTIKDKKINIIQFERHADDLRDDKFPAINEFLNKNGYSKIKEIKHPFGDFFEMLYQRT
jgi:FkbM family methyltransferase